MKSKLKIGSRIRVALSRTESSYGAIAAYLAIQHAAALTAYAHEVNSFEADVESYDARVAARAALDAATAAHNAARAHRLCMSAIGTRSRDYSRRME